MTAQITLVPLSHLALAPENARAETVHDEAGIRALAGSITALGGLLEPLKGYADGEAVMVWDGGRRLLALRMLQQLPDGMAGGVPVIVTSQAEADLASHATFVREDMHPADRFLAWNALFDNGHSEDMIAAAVGASTRDVQRLLRFRSLAPEIFTAFKDGLMDLDAAFAFTLTTDHEAQRQVLASFGDRQPDAWSIKSALRESTVNARDKRARFVGAEDYEAAGGRFLRDLFSDHEVDADWLDVALLQKLYDAKIAALVDEVGGEGWGDVIVREDSWSWREGLMRVTAEGEDGAHTAEQMAESLAVVTVTYQGASEIHRGYTWMPNVARAKAAGAVETPQKAKPAVYGFSHAGHETMTKVATVAAQDALAINPALAYDAAVAHMAWVGVQSYGNHAHGPSKLAISYGDRPKVLSGAVREKLEAWAKRLPDTRAAFVEAVADLTAEEKADLLALSYAASLDAVEPKVTDQSSEARREIGWLARRGGVDFAAVWTPDAGFLKGASKDALLAVVKELAPREYDRWTGAKKAALVEFVAQKAEQTGWTPQFLRDLIAEPEAPKPAAKPARKGRAKAKVAA